MKDLEFPTTAATLGRSLGARVIGNGDAEIRLLSSLENAREGTLSFFSNKKYGSCLTQIKGAVLFTSESLARPELPLTYIIVPDPQTAFAAIAGKFAARPAWPGISPQSVIHPKAVLKENVHVGPFAVISEGASIGAGTVVQAFAYIAPDVVIGEDCQIHSHVTILDRTEIGNRVKVFPGSVIGSDGFGFFGSDSPTGHKEMPQIGNVVIEDDVRIGAHCTVDRATLGETRIGRGTKLDDQVHVGHNCRVEKNVILCAQVGLGGSVVIEENVILAGQVGIGHGVTVGKGARMGGQSGSGTNVKGGETYFMTPAIPIKDTVKVVRYMRKLPEIWARLKKLEESLGKGE